MTVPVRFAAVLLGAFVLWLPALGTFLRGGVGAGGVGFRFAVAVGIVWGGLALLGRIVAGYAAEMPVAVDDDAPRRRIVDEEPGRAGGPVSEDPSFTGASGG